METLFCLLYLELEDLTHLRRLLNEPRKKKLMKRNRRLNTLLKSQRFLKSKAMLSSKTMKRKAKLGLIFSSDSYNDFCE